MYFKARWRYWSGQPKIFMLCHVAPSGDSTPLAVEFETMVDNRFYHAIASSIPVVSSL